RRPTVRCAGPSSWRRPDHSPRRVGRGGRVGPMEAAHRPQTLRASARLAASELLLTGTTTALTMETVHDTDVVFETLEEIGLRAVVGKCMMDSAHQVPVRLRGKTRASNDES